MPIEKDNVSGQETTGHEWDGIKELNTPLPKVLLWAYAITIIVALAGWLLYPSVPFGTDYFRGLLGTTSRVSVLEEVKIAQARRNSFEREIIVGDIYALVENSDIRMRHESAAEVLFNDNCAACHGADLQGQHNFPNLVDDSWLFYDDVVGNDLDEIEQTIRYGINDQHDDARYNEMSAYGRDQLLERDAIRDVAEFVLSLSGATHDKPAAERGAEVFALNCVSCHGEDGKGIGIGAPDLTDSFWLYGGDKSSILDVLDHGRAGHMPAFDSRLGDAEIRKLVLYLQWKREDAKSQE